MSDVYYQDPVGFPWIIDAVIVEGKLDQVIEWCKRTTGDNFLWTLVEPYVKKYKYRFFFAKKKEYLLFLLTWT